MKIENSGIQALNTRPAETPTRIAKKEARKDVNALQTGQDKAEMSENARLLARARTELGNVEETSPERLESLRQEIQSGEYTVQVNELARKLVAKFYQK
jgi:flagellar biosynthesis anti-sigma factor FlgM